MSYWPQAPCNTCYRDKKRECWEEAQRRKVSQEDICAGLRSWVINEKQRREDREARERKRKRWQ